MSTGYFIIDGMVIIAIYKFDTLIATVCADVMVPALGAYSIKNNIMIEDSLLCNQAYLDAYMIRDMLDRSATVSGPNQYYSVQTRSCRRGCNGCDGSYASKTECMLDDAADAANERYYDSFTV